MALNFDMDDAPTFHELVRDARHNLMKGREMATCWSELADQHAFFKDIAKEGHARGASLGAVLAAVQGICQVVERVELSHSEVEGSSPACTAAFSSPARRLSGDLWPDSRLEEARALARVVGAYCSLYCSTPIPRHAQWVSSLKPVFRESTNGASTAVNDASASRRDDDANASHATPASSTLGRYLTRLRQRVESVAQELPDSELYERSGSVAEEELKELVLCCIAAGRRVIRSTALSHADARLVREMVMALQDFVGSSTLEW
ncbi:hypothetical protein LSCM1_01098 [Leishmania martiniquensis]|uniref:Uncharacterized protein n=1 Tax=Leishmania martiniquensis TaxID=1580590 RepID=A0A836G2Z5_9TRYP|nr:hypothetical protein LSCM1_01098 [Leishmania martiniquensis]